MIPFVSNATTLPNGGNDVAHQPEKARLVALDRDATPTPNMNANMS